MVSEKEEDFSAYKIEDLILNESFVRWVKYSHPEDERYWQSVLAKCPHLKDMETVARSFILDLQFTENMPSVFEKWEFKDQMRRMLTAQSPQRRLVKLFSNNWFRVAAVFCGLLVGGTAAIFTLRTNGYERKATEYGQMTTILLPDGSTVNMNSNSRLRYHNDWKKDGAREVWLEGEAYFNVKHLNKDEKNIKPSERFIVHTGDIDITVLGTSFNVKNRHDQAQITLVTGKINVTTENKKITMKPGDQLLINEVNSKQTIRKEVKTTQSAAWKENKVVFNEATIEEVTQLIEDKFGYKVKIEANIPKGKTISGTVSTENEEALLKAIAELFEVKVEKNQDHKNITIQ